MQFSLKKTVDQIKALDTRQAAAELDGFELGADLQGLSKPEKRDVIRNATKHIEDFEEIQDLAEHFERGFWAAQQPA
jgi:hypothetical protein